MNLWSVLDLIFPAQCVLCGDRLDAKHQAGAGVVCGTCFECISLKTTLACGRCGARLPDAKKICHFDFPYTLGSATSYDDEAARKLIHALKFDLIKDASKPLGSLLARYAEQLPVHWETFWVVPIPLSRQRERSRGFNQSLLIADEFARIMSLQISPHVLERVKGGPPQSDLKGRAARQENVSGCFRVPEIREATPRNVVLIDDVTTSGATFLEAANVLKSSLNVRRVIALAVAKA